MLLVLLLSAIGWIPISYISKGRGEFDPGVRGYFAGFAERKWAARHGDHCKERQVDCYC